MNILEEIENVSIKAPQIWKDFPNEHWKSVLNHPWYKNLFKIQNEIQCSVHQFFQAENYMLIHAPISTGSISSPMGLGSDSVPVKVNIQGVDTYLADSMQFMLELGCRQSDKGVYYMMPCFRGETTDEFHLPEFYHIESEIVGNLDNVIELCESLIKKLCRNLLDNCDQEIQQMAGDLRHLKNVAFMHNESFPRVRHKEAVSILSEINDSFVNDNPAGFKEINRKGEQKLVELLGRNDAIWITHFPRKSVPFYQADDDDGLHSINADLILGKCETIGCGQRHFSKAEALNALKEREVSLSSYGWYVDMKDEAPLQTSGFGLGLERFLMWLFRHNDIRDMTMLYRENGLPVIP